VLWLAALGAGFGVMWRYESTPGPGGGPPSRWPARSAIARRSGLPTLVMFAHPQCVCSRASLGELERLKSRFDGRLAAYVVFLRPSDGGEEWDRSDLWDRAAAMPGVTALRDVDGREAARFGVVTSGHTLAYDAQGGLLFSGGLTAARGREGEAKSARQIAALLTTGQADRAVSPVFGCALAHGALPDVEPSNERGRR